MAAYPLMNVRYKARLLFENQIRPFCSTIGIDLGQKDPASLRNRFLLGVYWSVIGAIISQGLGLLANVITARILGKVCFGELGIVQNTVGMFGVFAGLGLGVTATKYVAEFRSRDPIRAGQIIGLVSVVSLVLGGGVALLVFIISPYLATRTLNAPHLTTGVRIGCGLLFFNALNGAQTGALAGCEAFKTIAKTNLIRGVITFPVTIVGVYLYGVDGAVMGMVFAGAIGWFVNHIFLRRELSKANVTITYDSVWSELPILWKFSLPAFLCGVTMGPVLWLSSAVLVNQRGGYAQMGIFSAANRLMIILTVLPSFISQVALPILSDLYGKEEWARYNRFLFKLIGIYAACSFVVALPMCLFSPKVMSMFGKEFVQGWPTLCILLASTSLSVINSVIGQAIASAGHVWFGALVNGLWGASLILFSLWFIPFWGAVGLSLSMLVAYILYSIWQALYVYFRVANLGRRDKRVCCEPVGLH